MRDKHLDGLNRNNAVSGTMYATIKRGKVRVKIGSAQQRLLEARNLPYSIVKIRGGKKTIKRMNTK